MARSRMVEQIGRVLGDRYRLLAPIGRGASAQVFVADDVRLRRQVAVKVLHDALADDQEFLRRFRAEAQAAAALNHPHVMSVYDWGQDGDEAPWIVTEFLGGGSLRALLDRGHRLTPSQALVVGLQAARGLEYAHRRGFVHRDVKPANLLFDDDGRLRIADFGLARALAEAAWTEPQGAVVGTARYASPEQAQGLSLSGRADVYSLALVLTEAVTGEVPFATDTTLGTLMARVGADLVAPEALGPLGEAVEAAGRPDPEERLDARALGDALARVASELPRPSPLPLAGALEVDLAPDRDPTRLVGAPIAAGTGGADDGVDGVDGDDDDEGPRDDGSLDEGGSSPVGPVVPVVPLGGVEGDGAVPPGEGAGSGGPALGLGDAGPPGEEEHPFEPGAVARSDDDHTVVDAPWRPVAVGADATALAATPVPSGEGGEGDAGPELFDAAEDEEWEDDDGGEPWDPRSPTGRRRRRWPWITLAVLLLAGVGVAAGMLVADLVEGTPIHEIPTVEGLTEDAARSTLTQLGYQVDVERTRRDGTEAGDVLGTRPSAGTELEEGELVIIVVSDGPTEVDLPELPRGLPVAEAEARLGAVGLVMVPEPRFDEEVSADQVIEVLGDPPARLEKGTEVRVAVSRGPEPRTVPDGLVGASRDDAVAALEALGLVAAPEGRFSDDVAAGVVMSTDPGAGAQIARGETVRVVVSRGPDLVTVPDVRGTDSPREAAALLEAEGLVAGDVRGPAAGFPAGTSPAAGEQVRRGSEVEIILQRRSGGGGDDDD